VLNRNVSSISSATLTKTYTESHLMWSSRSWSVRWRALLKPIIETVDKFGLKARFLRRHKIDVDRFFKRLSRRDCQSGTSLRCKQRLEKNRDTLFTFLDHDDVPAATAAREPPKGARCDSSPRNLRAPAATAAREPQFRPAPRLDFEINTQVKLDDTANYLDHPSSKLATKSIATSEAPLPLTPSTARTQRFEGGGTGF
jgi:hypothetical protein